MFIFFFFFALALSALHLYNEPKFMVVSNPVILEQSHAHNAPDLWDRGSISISTTAVDSNKKLQHQKHCTPVCPSFHRKWSGCRYSSRSSI